MKDSLQTGEWREQGFLPPRIPYSSSVHEKCPEDGAGLVLCLEISHQVLFFIPSSVILVMCGLGDAQARDRVGRGKNLCCLALEGRERKKIKKYDQAG